MLFDLKTAIKLRTHYKYLIGTPLTPGATGKTSGLFICRQGEAVKTIEFMLAAQTENLPNLIQASDDGGKIFEVYVYHDNGADIAYHELDKNLTDRGEEKIYPH